MFIFGKYIYLNPVRTITSFDDIESAFFELEQWQKEQPQEKQSQKKSQQHKEHGFWVGYISYEAKDTFHSQKPKSSPSSMLTPMLSSTPPMPILNSHFSKSARDSPHNSCTHHNLCLLCLIFIQISLRHLIMNVTRGILHISNNNLRVAIAIKSITHKSLPLARIAMG